jgi:hypothetical protein
MMRVNELHNDSMQQTALRAAADVESQATTQKQIEFRHLNPNFHHSAQVHFQQLFKLALSEAS